MRPEGNHQQSPTKCCACGTKRSTRHRPKAGRSLGRKLCSSSGKTSIPPPGHPHGGLEGWKSTEIFTVVVDAPPNNIEYMVIEATNLWQWLSFLGGFHQSSRGLYEMYSDNPSTIRVCVLCLSRTTTANLMRSWLTPDENPKKHLKVTWEYPGSGSSRSSRRSQGLDGPRQKRPELCAT